MVLAHVAVLGSYDMVEPVTTKRIQCFIEIHTHPVYFGRHLIKLHGNNAK